MAATFQRNQGQVPNTQSNIVPAVTNTTIVFSQIYHNTSASAVTLEIWVSSGANTRQVLNQSVAADTTVIFNEKINLVAGDSVQAQASTTNVIDYWISAVEIT